MKTCQATFLDGGLDSPTMLRRSLFHFGFFIFIFTDFHDVNPDRLSEYMLRRSLFEFVGSSYEK